MKTTQNLLAFFFVLLLACNSSSPETPDSPEPTGDTSMLISEVPEKPVVPDNRIPLYLNGMYATSTDPASDIQSVFDKDETTVWKTIKGAGPDEGIMLYFKEETFIKSITVEGAQGESYAEIESISIYGNGAPLYDISSGEEGEINENLWNVYLRFAVSDGAKKMSRTIENEYYPNVEIIRFDKNKSIGIKRIIIEGQDGEFRIVSPQLLNGDVTASSTLNAENYAYDPSLLFDGRKEFVWVEGAAGNGEGEKLVFNFKQDVTISGLMFWNGYQRSESHYNSNARLKSFDFGKPGVPNETYQLKDQSGVQQLKFKTSQTGNAFEFEIKTAYKGWSYKDLAISEILFFDEADALFGIKSLQSDVIRNSILQKSKGTVLEGLLDSRILNEYESEEYIMYLTRSVILRSDGTFVMYSLETDEADSVEIIADGNWEIKEAGPESAVISVFGKLLDFSMLEMYYAGKEDAELSRIFRDKITIDRNSISGEKLWSPIEY